VERHHLPAVHVGSRQVQRSRVGSSIPFQYKASRCHPAVKGSGGGLDKGKSFVLHSMSDGGILRDVHND
jgi:hypothetical protein